jgi:hypothetical protein
MADKHDGQARDYRQIAWEIVTNTLPPQTYGKAIERLIDAIVAALRDIDSASYRRGLRDAAEVARAEAHVAIPSVAKAMAARIAIAILAKEKDAARASTTGDKKDG